MSPSSRPVALVLHGGAGARKGRDYSPQLAVLERLAREGHDRLASGAPAIEVVVDMVAELEDCGLFVAGRGAVKSLWPRVADWLADRSTKEGES